MKRKITVALICFTVFTVSAQQGCQKIEDHFNSTFTMCNVDRFSSSIYVKGKAAQTLMTKLFGEKNLNGFTHRLRRVPVPGIESMVNLKILEGMHGYDRLKGAQYFNIYTNESNKITRLENIQDNEKEGIIIYFRINGSDVVSIYKMECLMSYFKRLVA